MKIKWEKFAPNILVGKVGDVGIFEMSLDPDDHKHGKTELICELPDVPKKHYGRLITIHPSPKAAAKAAQATLNHWLRRLKV